MRKLSMLARLAAVGACAIALTEALLALDFATDEPREIAIVLPRGAELRDAAPLTAVLRRAFVPNRALACAAEGDLAALARLAPFAADKVAVDGLPTAYVCRRGRCELPVTDPDALAAQLSPPPQGA